MLRIFGVIGFVTLLVAGAVFVYYLIYASSINKKIQSGQAGNRKLVDIPKAILIAVIVLLLSYAIILSAALRECNQKAAIVNRDSFAVIDLTDYTFSAYTGQKESSDAGFAKLFSREANPGYDKSVETDGDYVFTVFVRNADPDAFHPDFLCFVDYVGEVGDGLQSYGQCRFVNDESGNVAGGIATGGGDVGASLLYIGNLNDGDSFTITEGILDVAGEQAFQNAVEAAYDGDQGDFPSFADYAVSVGTVVIRMNGVHGTE